LIFDEQQEPELFNFIQAINTGEHKFNDYPTEQLEYFARRIYELRKNNSNNTAG
jgi:hypothetical protein